MPIIATDWWEPIYSIDSEHVLGHVQILTALGTEEQINSLKSERGFTNTIVKAAFVASQPNQSKYGKQSVPSATDKLNCKIPYSKYKSKNEHGTRDFLQLERGIKFKDNITDNNRTTLGKLESQEQFLIKDNSHLTEEPINSSRSHKVVHSPQIKKFDIGTQSDMDAMENVPESQDKTKISPTQEMLGSFLNQLMAQRQKNIFVENSTNTETSETVTTKSNEGVLNAQSNTNLQLKKTTDLLDSLQKALSFDSLPNSKSMERKPDTFKANIFINSANHLPSRKKWKSKKNKNRSIKNEDNFLPSCYVSFEIVEGDIRVTPVIAKTVNPTWNHKCEVDLPVDLLTNSQRRLIFKVWRKASNTVLAPNMQTDVVLGFAAVDLTVLLAGFPNVQGWFNIIDFTGKCNGQINIHIIPLQNLSKYFLPKPGCSCNTPLENDSNARHEDEPSEIFSRTLKRKFSELDEITQRLRLRLSKVTNDDSDTSSDGIADEFEKDINTLCIEEDFDLINFEEETRKLDLNNKEYEMKRDGCSSKLQSLLSIKENDPSSKDGDCILDNDVHMSDENKISSSDTATSLSDCRGDLLGLVTNTGTDKELSTLDKQLCEGKQKIDTLLEKLSLISADTNNTFTSRYVSGCSLSDGNSANVDTEAILKELDHYSRPNIQSSLGFEPLKFQQLYGGSVDSESLKDSGSGVSYNSNSDTSLITNFSECRPTPDGKGNKLDEKLIKD
ncbi:hypothetical protein NQ315_014962 [Exocentrus adspersus]|uniref:C2 domain-containing protein n=1 Tax=Exocentrus adspersus TaxID=1586481 RepID=A0AAV8V879_9CUCU|nr:hypothetical protein NQ315_014962 [Exocentrus adspersus]